MQNRRTKNGIHPVKITIVIVILIFLAGWSIYAIGNHPNQTAKSQATSLAKKYGKLTSTSAFYTYNRDKTYYTVAGTNNKDKKIYVIVAQKGGKIRIIKQSAGITKNQALTQIWTKRSPKKVLKISMGVFNDRPVWEVTYLNKKGNLCYELLNFKNGKDIQKITNL